MVLTEETRRRLLVILEEIETFVEEMTRGLSSDMPRQGDEAPMIALTRLWRILPAEQLVPFLIEHLTPEQRRQICEGLDDKDGLFPDSLDVLHCLLLALLTVGLTVFPFVCACD